LQLRLNLIATETQSQNSIATETQSQEDTFALGGLGAYITSLTHARSKTQNRKGDLC